LTENITIQNNTIYVYRYSPSRYDCVSLGMSVFVAFFVLLLLLADSTPPAAASIPLIGMININHTGMNCVLWIRNCR